MDKNLRFSVAAVSPGDILSRSDSPEGQISGHYAMFDKEMQNNSLFRSFKKLGNKGMEVFGQFLLVFHLIMADGKRASHPDDYVARPCQ